MNLYISIFNYGTRIAVLVGIKDWGDILTFCNVDFRLVDREERPTVKTSTNVSRKGMANMNEFLIMLGIFGAWFALQAFILPRFGIET